MIKLEKKIANMFTLLERISYVALVAALILTVVNILTRALINKPIYGSFEGVCYLSLIMAVCTMPNCEYHNQNVTVTVILDYISSKGKRVLGIITNTIALIGCSVVSFNLIGLAQKKYINADITADLKIPIYIFAVFITIGFILLTLCILLKLIKLIRTSIPTE